MPYSASRPPKDLKKKIKKRHPGATKKEIQQFVHVFNNVHEKTNSDAAAYAAAWGVLNKNKNLESSHEKTDPEQTKKDVKKWNKKNKIKPPKKKKKTKKSHLIAELIKVANNLDSQGHYDLAQEIDSYIRSITD